MRIPHNRIVAAPGDADAVARVVERGHWAMGPETAALERSLARALGRRRCVVVASGLGALRLALASLGVGAGDEVLVPAYCCVALPNAALSLGAVPVDVDCDPMTLNIDPRSAASRRTGRTRAAVVVNTFGLPADYAALRGLGIPVLEDCAHGFGTGGLGRSGDLAVLSLYATKFIGAGEGGAVSGDDDRLLSAVASLRDYTDKQPSGVRLNDKPDDLNCALCASRLGRIEEIIESRAVLAARYRDGLHDLAASGSIGFQPEGAGRIWYRFVLRVPVAARWIDALRHEGIGAARPVECWLDEATMARNPGASAAYRQAVSLPLYPNLAEAEVDEIVAVVRRLAAGAR